MSAGEYFGLDDDGYEAQITDECLRKSAHQLREEGTYQSQLMYTPYTVRMGQLTLYRSLVIFIPFSVAGRVSLAKTTVTCKTKR